MISARFPSAGTPGSFFSGRTPARPYVSMLLTLLGAESTSHRDPNAARNETTLVLERSEGMVELAAKVQADDHSRHLQALNQLKVECMEKV